MLQKDTIYNIKIDNPQTVYELTLLDEIIDNNLLNVKVKIRDGVYNKMTLTKIDPKDIINGNDYYIISNNTTTFQKTTVVNVPVFDQIKNSISFQGKILGELRLASKGIVQFYIPLDMNDMLIYKLELIGRYTNEWS